MKKCIGIKLMKRTCTVVTSGTSRRCWSFTSFFSGATRTYCSCISVTVEPQGDTVVALTVSDGGSSVTPVSVEYAMAVALLPLCH